MSRRIELINVKNCDDCGWRLTQPLNGKTNYTYSCTNMSFGNPHRKWFADVKDAYSICKGVYFKNKQVINR